MLNSLQVYNTYLRIFLRVPLRERAALTVHCAGTTSARHPRSRDSILYASEVDTMTEERPNAEVATLARDPPSFWHEVQ